MSEQTKAFAKYDARGEDLARRVISGAVKASATEQAYALLWLIERETRRVNELERAKDTEDVEGRLLSQMEVDLEIAKSALLAQHLAATAALKSAKSQERTERSARIVNSLALIAIALSIFALWSNGQRQGASIQNIAASTMQTVADILQQL